MKKLILLVLLLTQLSFSQETRYEFAYRENRTPTGWNRIETTGEVIFYEDTNTNTITIVTSQKYQQLYVVSKQLFIRQDSYIYTLVDDYHNECRIRLVIKDSTDILELYYYSDRVEEKYYRLILKKCR